MRFTLRMSFVLLLCASGSVSADELPDIRSVPADIEIPVISDGPPAPGKRVKLGANFLYLPSDWTKENKMPVLVELPGNAWKSPHGDVSSGLPEDCRLGYGLTEGRGAIWLSVPFLNAKGDKIASTWWGNAPDFEPQATIKALRDAVGLVCAEYGGDESKVVLCGFSRGAIACNYIGLYDDETAKLWRAFVVCSHYDGTRRWVPRSERDDVLKRLSRLGKRPQLILGEAENVPKTEAYLESLHLKGQFTFLKTGFRNHTDAWVLRPSVARDQARDWLKTNLGMR